MLGYRLGNRGCTALPLLLLLCKLWSLSPYDMSLYNCSLQHSMTMAGLGRSVGLGLIREYVRAVHVHVHVRTHISTTYDTAVDICIPGVRVLCMK